MKLSDLRDTLSKLDDICIGDPEVIMLVDDELLELETVSIEAFASADVTDGRVATVPWNEKLTLQFTTVPE